MSSKRTADGAITRRRILDSAVDCLIERGVAGTSTLAVQERAGISRGALLHHFPTHQSLLAASVAELVVRNERAVEEARIGSRGKFEPLHSAVRALAFAAHQPAYLAELELWAVSRTNSDLKKAIISAERLARRDIDRVQSELFAEWSQARGFAEAMALIQVFIRGLAITDNIRTSPQRREKLIAGWVEVLRPLLESSSPTKAAKA